MAILSCLLLICIDLQRHSSTQAERSDLISTSGIRSISPNTFNSFLSSNDLLNGTTFIASDSTSSAGKSTDGKKKRKFAAKTKKMKKKKRRRQRVRTKIGLYRQGSVERPYKRWSLRHLNAKKTPCGVNECYPPIGDLLLGRKKYLYASSTCGLDQASRYCKIGLTSSYKPGPYKLRNYPFLSRRARNFLCDVCDSSEPFNERNPVSHRIENVVFDKLTYAHDMPRKWWQSENGKHNVFIQFDMEAEFTMTHIIMRFETYPPAAMIMEKSSDFGRSWHPIAYYASDCAFYFPSVRTQWSYDISEPICISRYNTDQYSTGAELLYRPLSRFFVGRHNNPAVESIKNKSDVLENKLKITNLRINFTQLQMHGDQIFPSSNDDSSLIYYYAVSEMRVFGSCFCNGHGIGCLPISNDLQYDPEVLARKEADKMRMVGGRCNCDHNTMGPNCERCQPLYNDRQWTYGKPCVKCNCNEHASACYFDENVFDGHSGGVCINCMHNTEGRNCERCKVNYYRDPKLNSTDPGSCKPCKCNHLGSLSSYLTVDGGYACSTQNCECKANVEGETCDKCKDGFWNLTLDNEQGCQQCPCRREGTVGNRGCDKRTGKCYACKPYVIGDKCDTCASGYYGISLEEDGCKPCECSIYGSYPVPCDRETGQCVCRPHAHGRQCDTIEDGFFCPSLDYLTLEAEYTTLNKSFVHDRESTSWESTSWSGVGYLRVYDGSVVLYSVEHLHATGFYSVLMRYDEYIANDFGQVRTKIIDNGVSLSKASMERKNKLEPVFNCAKLSTERARVKSAHLDRRARSKTIFDNYCFEQYHSYVIEISFESPYRSMNSILIDSVNFLSSF